MSDQLKTEYDVQSRRELAMEVEMSTRTAWGAVRLWCSKLVAMWRYPRMTTIEERMWHTGRDAGIEDGKRWGRNIGYDEGLREGYDRGYRAGMKEAAYLMRSK